MGLSSVTHRTTFRARAGRTWRDPVSQFKLRNNDRQCHGEMIGAFGCPTLFVLEGGCAVDDIGISPVNILTGFEQSTE